MGPGVYPAAVTPFDEKGRVDMPGVARLLAWFASHGCKGAVLAGTNGEGPSLSAGEKRDLVRGSVPVAEKLGLEIVLGIATPSTDEATWLCRHAHDSGAAAVLLMPPGYFREASEAGIEAWFRHVLDRSPLPVLVYNFPKRAGVTLSADLLSRLASHERFLGAKDSSGERENLAAYREATGDKLLYVGDETLLWQALEAGWTGTISGAANCIPRWLSRVVDEFPSESAETKFEFILPAIHALRSIAQPGGNKRILQMSGVADRADPRLPLLAVSEESVAEAFRLVSSLQGP